MLELKLPDVELFNEETEEFVYVKGRTITLEHSLVSLSKWEAKWQKPFLRKEGLTPEETLDYIRCMTIEKNVDPMLYKTMPADALKKVKDYIDSPMTATWFSDDKKGSPSRETITSELVYYWMITSNIPFECQKWHLNRLLTLIKICSIKNQPPKKMSKKDIMSRNRALNEARRRQLNTTG